MEALLKHTAGSIEQVVLTGSKNSLVYSSLRISEQVGGEQYHHMNGVSMHPVSSVQCVLTSRMGHRTTKPRMDPGSIRRRGLPEAAERIDESHCILGCADKERQMESLCSLMQTIH